MLEHLSCQHKSGCLYKYKEERDAQKNKVMKIIEQWEELKEKSYAIIQSEKGSRPQSAGDRLR